ncbi:hypothetical protein ACFLRA_02830 [Bdellovibrionota bacterium]
MRALIISFIIFFLSPFAYSDGELDQYNEICWYGSGLAYDVLAGKGTNEALCYSKDEYVKLFYVHFRNGVYDRFPILKLDDSSLPIYQFTAGVNDGNFSISVNIKEEEFVLHKDFQSILSDIKEAGLNSIYDCPGSDQLGRRAFKKWTWLVKWVPWDSTTEEGLIQLIKLSLSAGFSIDGLNDLNYGYMNDYTLEYFLSFNPEVEVEDGEPESTINRILGVTGVQLECVEAEYPIKPIAGIVEDLDKENHIIFLRSEDGQLFGLIERHADNYDDANIWRLKRGESVRSRAWYLELAWDEDELEHLRKLNSEAIYYSMFGRHELGRGK